jgi:putative ABC transport system permease protein
MIQNYLKIALRGFSKNRSFTLLNLLSLVIGLFVSYVAISYIVYEGSYDKFHKNAGEIYRLGRTYRHQNYSIIDFENKNGTTANKQAQISLIESFKKITGVKDATQFIVSTSYEFIESNNKRIQQKNILVTNTPKSFVEIFSWKLKSGSFKEFSEGTNKAIISASTAEKLFGNTALNDKAGLPKSIRISNVNYQLSGIVEDVPANAHFDFQIALNKPIIDYWGSRIYLQLDKNSNSQTVENQINKSISTIIPRIVKDANYQKHFLQNITDIHLKSNSLYDLKPTGNTNYIFIIGFFALFIVIIMLFNYTNLLLAMKFKQSKNIGIKKIMGASKFSIIGQILIESFILSLVAVGIVSELIFLLVPHFNTLMDVSLDIDLHNKPQTLLFLTALGLSIGFLASVLPALYLSSKDAVSLIKENLRGNKFQTFSVRKYLIISQFSLLICITSTSYFISKQISFIRNKDTGFQKKGIIYAYTSEKNQGVFQQKLSQCPEIKAVGNGSRFGIMPFNKQTYKLEKSNQVFADAQQLYLDYAAIKAYNLKTTLNKNQNTLSNTLIINRTAAAKLAKLEGISTEEIIGKTIVLEPEYTAPSGQVGFPTVIAGIYEDINLFSLHEKIEPYFIIVSPNLRMDGRSIIAYDPKNTAEVLQKINTIHKSLDEPFPLELEFLEENLTNLHKQDEQAATLLFYFNIIAVLLASLGIIGITIFLIVARTKEIGIRKILGASEFSIVRLVVNEYVFFIGLAFAVSTPIAFWIIKEWLMNFAYRIDIQWYVFVLVGLLAFVFTAFIVGTIAFRAALANPVKSLRTE